MFCTRRTRGLYVVLLLVLTSIALSGSIAARRTEPLSTRTDRSRTPTPPLSLRSPVTGPVSPTADSTPTDPATSHRLIVELASPPLAVWAQTAAHVQSATGRPDLQAPAAQAYLAQLQREQTAFVQSMRAALPSAFVSTFVNELGAREPNTYQVVFNGLSIDPGTTSIAQARQRLRALPNVKDVYLDFAHHTTLYTSTKLINAPEVWNSPAIGGRNNAGAGIKVASMDGGVHKDAPMFNGAGYSYPPGFPPGGLGLTANNNGKIIASRAYFRAWDPPAPGDENPWPGQNGTEHGVHTAGIAAGNVVTATYLGLPFPNMSGVAPKAWVMSYRVFYQSVNNNGSFYTSEGIAALEDIARDGADVLNNSWGEGPTAAGNEFDPLDTALRNTAAAGVFVAMSAGNSGPGNGTTDHPSDDYINVAASTSGGTLAAGRLNVTAPTPVSDTLKQLPIGTADFGEFIGGKILEYQFIPAKVISPTNELGCTAWGPGTFTGKAVLISRGSCEFGVKVLNAERAGAAFVVVYNSVAGGDALMNMGAGAVGHQVTIPSLFIGRSNGLKLLDWYQQHGAASKLEANMVAFQLGNQPDVIASFSSRGPGVGNVLKPDITAPGVNILSQGYTPGATGEARHLGYGQVSGTSMAAPHVAGAAALLRQLHPSWSNAAIRSALMSTSKYLNIYTHDGKPAQPLDMGAGRLDLAKAVDPGVILDPPSLSFGHVPTDTTKTITVTVRSVAAATETYTLTTLFTGNGFTQTTSLPGFSVAPSTITLAPGQSTTFSVTFSATSGRGYGENQGFIILDGPTHDAHLPAWARVTYATPLADVLLLDNDGSGLPVPGFSFANYTGYYTQTLSQLGYSYHVWDVDARALQPTTLPDMATLLAYRAILYFTGDNYLAVMPATDQDKLTQYANNGGVVIVMGQDATGALNSTTTSTFFYGSVLGANYLQDSVTNQTQPAFPVTALPSAPPAFKNIKLDLSAPQTFTANVALSGANEVPPVNSGVTGLARLSLNRATRILDYSITITSTSSVTLTMAHVHTGTVGVNGGILSGLYSGSQAVNGSFTFGGQVLLDQTTVTAMFAGRTYINVHTSQNPAGAARGQIALTSTKDGAGNQIYIDEIRPAREQLGSGDPNIDRENRKYVGLLKYPGLNNIDTGTVAVAKRDQPFLELPGVANFNRAIYASFGLEGVNNSAGMTSRAQLLRTFFNWAWDTPQASITATTVSTSTLTTFTASLSSPITGTTGVSYRWDFGDGSPIAGPYAVPQAGHTYTVRGTYTVRVEVTDSYGNVAIGTTTVQVPYGNTKLYFPLLPR